MVNLPKQPIKGLIDGITVLQSVAVQTSPSSVSDLSRELGLEKTRVHRILGTLAHLGILHRTEKGLYAAGSGMHILAAQSMFSSGLIHSALPRLEKLGQTGLTVGFGLLWKDKVSFLYHQGPGLTPLESLGRVGVYEATRSSVGMALLAHKSKEAVKELYSGKDIPGFTSLSVLNKELAQIRKKGFSDVTGEGTHHSISMVIGNPVYAGIALAGSMTASAIKKHAVVLRKTAGAIEGDMSGE